MSKHALCSYMRLICNVVVTVLSHLLTCTTTQSSLPLFRTLLLGCSEEQRFRWGRWETSCCQSVISLNCTDVNVDKCSAHVLYECSVDPQRTVTSSGVQCTHSFYIHLVKLKWCNFCTYSTITIIIITTACYIGGFHF